MKKMKCTECGGVMHHARGEMPDGIPYERWDCSCGESVLDMNQLGKLAKRYREMKRHRVKVCKWGGSLGIRIPKALTEKYGIDSDDEMTIIPEKDGMRIINA